MIRIITPETRLSSANDRVDVCCCEAEPYNIFSATVTQKTAVAENTVADSRTLKEIFPRTAVTVQLYKIQKFKKGPEFLISMNSYSVVVYNACILEMLNIVVIS
jgi:hypothetical protein